MRRALITGVASCLMVLAVAACGTASPPPSVAIGATAEPTPGGVATWKAALVGASTVSGTCQPIPGVAPTGSLPAPGHMPAGSTMAAIYARQYLRVGVDQTTQFFGYRYPDGTLDGFDIQVANDIAKAIFGTAAGHIRYTVITSAQRIPERCSWPPPASGAWASASPSIGSDGRPVHRRLAAGAKARVYACAHG